MSDLLLINAVLDGKPVDVDIRDGKFKAIMPAASHENNSENGIPVLDASGKALLPAFYNTHTHSGMSLLRGYADDLELFDWLNNYIWPLEANLEAENIYAGTRLAMVEMIRGGTVFFNDMYWHPRVSIQAAEAMKMRICAGRVIMDAFDEALGLRQFEEEESILADRAGFGKKTMLNISPHAVYTVREKSLVRAADIAKKHQIPLHIHLSETAREVSDCKEAHGCSPVEWLEHCGVFEAKVIAAHAIHVSDSDLKILASHDVTISHNPSSNHKLTSGIFPYHRHRNAGIPVSLGTDSSSSNNNLSMMESMKMTALNAKMASGDPKSCPADEAWSLATENAATAFGLNAGKIEPGAEADFMLVNTEHPALVPGYHLISDMVYSADTSVIETVVCGGDILMQDRVIPGEAEILEDARRSARDLISRFRS